MTFHRRALPLMLPLIPLLIAATPTDHADLVDLPPTHWAAPQVKRVVKAGVLSGYPDHTFRGWKPVTRYELVMSATKLLPVEAPMGQVQVVPATDVSNQHWAYPAVCKLSTFGIGQDLWSDGVFAGHLNATRFDLAYVATEVHALGGPAAGRLSGLRPFEDVPSGHWAAPAVRQAKSLGLMGGLADTLFHGEAPIDRYQLAFVMDRLLARVAAPPSDTASVPEGLPVSPEP